MTDSPPEVPAALQSVADETQRNAALKQAVKQNAGRRAAVKAEESPKPLAPPIPMPGEESDVQEAVDAEREYAAQVAAAPAMAAAQRASLDKTYLVYVKCREQHLPHHPPHGIYLAAHPDGDMVTWDGWYSRQKKLGERYFPADVVCQVCALENRVTVLVAAEKTSPEGNIRINPRFLMRVARDRKRALIEGEHRVRRLGFDSVNGGRRDALNRAKAAGYEVYDE